MAHFNGNNPHLRINGENVEAIWRNINFDKSLDVEDTTGGAGVEWVSRQGKLKSISGRVTLMYDDASAAADFARLVSNDDVVAIVWGPEGNGAGKPAHDQDFIISGITGPTQGHDKPVLTIEFNIQSSGAPRKNMYAGDTF